MKYVILIYGSPKNWQHPLFLQYGDLSPEEREQQLTAFDAFNRNLEASGKMVIGTPLATPEVTKTLRERNGELSITDGPFAEAKEHLAGFLVVECEHVEEAYEIAKSFPDIKYSAVEIRQIGNEKHQYWGTTS